MLFDSSPRKCDLEILAFGFMLKLKFNQKTNQNFFVTYSLVFLRFVFLCVCLFPASYVWLFFIHLIVRMYLLLG